MHIFMTLMMSFMLIGILTLSPLRAQNLLSHFEFNSLPLTQAAVGPNGSAVNTSAQTDGTGVYFSTGGATTGLDLIVPGSALTPSSIDIIIEYSRNESTAYLYEHGGLSISISGGALTFTYEIQHNRVQTRTRTLGPVSIPAGSSGVFDIIQCGYDATSGEGHIVVNGVQLATHTGSSNRDLAWNSPGDVTIGRLLDGGGSGFVTLGSVAVYSGTIGITPVELDVFSALRKDDVVLLRWTTVTEVNNYGFEVQRRVSAADREPGAWKEIGFVAGAGSVNVPQQYAFEDTEPPAVAGDISYRLRQIDRDGTSTLSKAVILPNVIPAGMRLAHAGPNPFRSQSRVNLTLSQEGLVRLLLVDMAGRVRQVLEPGAHLQAGTYSYPVDADGLASGSYLLTALTDNMVASVRLVVQ
jgi:hypothetical protein